VSPGKRATDIIIPDDNKKLPEGGRPAEKTVIPDDRLPDGVNKNLSSAAQTLAKTAVSLNRELPVPSSLTHAREDGRISLRRIIDAIEVRARAERKWAELHEELKAKGGQPYQAKPTGSKKEPVETAPPTLEELGVDKKESAAAHKLAKMPEEKFETMEYRSLPAREDGR
jgi:hypothetical protein